MSINERIKILKAKGNLSTNQIAEWLSFTPQRLRQKFKEGIWDSVDELKIIAKHTGVPLDALITGEGFEVVSGGAVPQVKEDSVEYGIKRIPFYDVEAVGGLNGGDVSPVQHATGMIDIGDFLRDSEAAIRMAGNSMMPNYPPGCILGLIRKKNRNIIPGEVYVYEDEDGRHCKRLFYKDDDSGSDTYVCYSDTITRFESGPREGQLFYPPYVIKVNSVINLYTVVGIIKRNVNGPIKFKKS